jgi:hypothetical protein
MTDIASLQLPVLHCPTSISPGIHCLLQCQALAHKFAL